MKKLIIIPAYNEAKNIVNLLDKLKRKNDYDVVVINDCSTDNTAAVCEEYGAVVIDLPFNLGIGGAVQTGYKYALKNGYDVAIQVDGDGQHDPEWLDELIKVLSLEQNDMVIGSRFIEEKGFQSTWLRRWGIRYFTWLIQWLTKTKITDPTSGFRACNKEIIRYFAAQYPRDYPEPETIISLSRLGYRIVEIPVVMHERQEGVSSINSLRAIYYMVKVTLAIFVDTCKNEPRFCRGNTGRDSK